MKALRFDGKVAALAEVAVPAPEAGEAVVRPTRLGIASPDLAVADSRVAFTGVMGHEFVGVVEKVVPKPGREEDVKRWEGKRVVVGINIVCGRCERCRAG